MPSSRAIGRGCDIDGDGDRQPSGVAVKPKEDKYSPPPARVEWQAVETCRDETLCDTLTAWHRWRRARICPRWQDVDLYGIPPVLLPNTLILDVIGHGKDYRYRFWGTGISNLFGCDHTGKRLSEVAQQAFLDASREQYGAVLKHNTPLYARVLFHETSPQGASLRTLLLPVNDGKATATKIIAVSIITRKPVRGNVTQMLKTKKYFHPYEAMTTKSLS